MNTAHPAGALQGAISSASPLPQSHKSLRSILNRWVDLGLDRLSRLGLGDDAPCAVHDQEGKLFWAMENLPVREGARHFLICGKTGSGKTTVIRLFLQSIAHRIRSGRKRPEHLIVADSKCDIVPTLAGLGFHPDDENVWILNPYDTRCASWNLGEAAQTPLMARELATLLVPKEKNSTAPYFSDGARQLTFAAMLGLNEVFGSSWSLRDLLCALDSPEHIRGVAANHARAKRIVEGILRDDKHADGVISTLNVAMGRFEGVAALWHSNPRGRKFSVSDFLAKPGVLILGNDPALKESLWPLNAMLLKVLTQEILRGPNVKEPCHWFVLDEFPSMERVDCIHDLLELGRSKGASVMLGIPSLSSLMKVYEEHATLAMLGQCSTKTFLRLGDPKTAEWAEKCVGTIRYVEGSHSASQSRKDESFTVSESVVDRPQILASTFMDLPFPEEGGAFSLISDIPAFRGIACGTYVASEAFAMCRPDDQNVPAVIPRTNPVEQTIRPWSPDEVRFFCREPVADPEPAADVEPEEPAPSGNSIPDTAPRLPGLQPKGAGQAKLPMPSLPSASGEEPELPEPPDGRG